MSVDKRLSMLAANQNQSQTVVPADLASDGSGDAIAANTSVHSRYKSVRPSSKISNMSQLTGGNQPRLGHGGYNSVSRRTVESPTRVAQ